MKSFLFSSFLLLFSCFVAAQVGIGTTAPLGALDITSTTDGLLIPRVALTGTTTVLPVTTGTISELVYNTSTSAVGPNQVTPGFYYLSAASGPWIRIATGDAGWSITGNSGLSGTTNFLGTTDGVDVAFRRGNTAAGKIGATSTSIGLGALTNGAASNSTAFGNNALSVSTGNNNVAVGQNALQNSNTTAQWNTAVGNSALKGINSNAAQNNTAVGFEAMTGAGNISNTTAIGYHALFQNTVGNSTAVGFNALQAQVGGGQGNTGFGASVLNNNTDGDNNTAVGNQAGFGATGSDNTLVGYFAGQFSTGANNTAVGSNALKANGASANSVAVGVNALTLSTAANNTAIGFSAGSAITTGTGNVFIGNSAGSAEAGASSDKLYISNSATTATTSLIYGEFSPARILRTNSTFQIGDPAGTGYVFPVARGTNNQILQTNGTGTLSWVNSTNNYSLVRANLTANQILNSTGWQKITFNTTLFDIGSEFVTGTNRFVATKVGYYEINAGFHTFNKVDAEYYGIAVYKNGILYQETSAHHYGDKLISRTINSTLSLAINDYIEIYIFNGNQPTTIDFFTGKTYFEVKQIR